MNTNLFMFNIKGFQNRNNSCFIDTVLMSLYGYRKSPFFNFLKQNWSFKNENISDEINNNNDKNDIIIRKNIQKILKNLIEKVLNDEYLECSILRIIIEDFFKCKNVSNNLISGQQDVNEFYDRIVKIFNFNPICITTVRQSKISKNSKIIKEKPVIENMGYINIPNDGTEFDGFYRLRNPEWNDLGEDMSNWKNNKKNNKTYRWTRNIISSIKGKDCLIFYLNRTSAKIINGEYLSYKLQNKVTMPTFINFSDSKYFLFSSIIHLGTKKGGHYITILFNGKNYFIYDDMNNNNKILQCCIQKSKIEKLRNENGVMYFYYKI